MTNTLKILQTDSFYPEYYINAIYIYIYCKVVTLLDNNIAIF